MPVNAFWFRTLTSSALAIAGFTMVCSHLSLWEGDLEESEFLRSTALLGTREIAASIRLYFDLLFLMPLFELVPEAWARWKATKSIEDLEAMRVAHRRQTKQTAIRAYCAHSSARAFHSRRAAVDSTFRALRALRKIADPRLAKKWRSSAQDDSPG